MSTNGLPKGVITASVTPLNRDLSPDHMLLGEHCRDILARGGAGILLLGTTGEANSFSVDERKVILEELLTHGISAQSILVGTGTCSLTETIELTNHAAAQGVQNVLIMPPFYYRKVTDDGLLTYFEELFRHIANDTNVFLYHFPAMSGIDISIELLGTLIGRYPGRFVGIKDSGGDLGHMIRILEQYPGFRMYSGTERLLLETLQKGSEGCISATTNYGIDYAASVYKAYRDGNNTADAKRKMLDCRLAFEGNVLVTAVKGILHRRSGAEGWAHTRPPLTLPNAATLNFIEDKLNAIG